MAFTLTVSLDVTGRSAIVVGGGTEALSRVDALLAGAADVTVVTPNPEGRLVDLATTGRLTLRRRGYEPGDLVGAFVAYVTREDPTDVAAAWAEAEAHSVLLSTLDDVALCHFATPSVVRRGDLAITVATAGRAPALAKRLRRYLEDRLGPELGDLVEVLAEAREQALPRTVPFPQWAARWETALEDLDELIGLVANGNGDEVRQHVLDVLRRDVEVVR